MGYELHIERDEGQIPLAEWEAYVESTPELHVEPFLEATSPAGDTLRIEGPFAVWKHQGEVVGILRWARGRISGKAPDDAAIARMQQVAAALGARVRGAEGEAYDEPVKPPGPAPPPRGGGFFKRLFGG